MGVLAPEDQYVGIGSSDDTFQIMNGMGIYIPSILPFSCLITTFDWLSIVVALNVCILF